MRPEIKKELDEFAITPITRIVFALNLLQDIVDFNLYGSKRDEKIKDAKEIIINFIKEEGISSRKTIIGTIIDIRDEDNKTAKIASIDEDDSQEDKPGVFVELYSYDESRLHREWEKLGIKIGEKFRIDIKHI